MEVFTATMDNFTKATEATATALDSEGSAEKENQKYRKSLKGSLAELKTAWEDFSRKMVDSGMVTKVLQILTSAVKFLASDIGQATIKWGAFIAGATLAIKTVKPLISLLSGASFAKGLAGLFGGKSGSIFSGLTKGAKGAADAAETVGTKTSKLAKIASKVAPVLTNPYVLATAAAAGLVVALRQIPTASEKLEKGEKKLKKYQTEAQKARDKIDEINDAIEKADSAGEDTTNLDKRKAKWDEILEKAEEYEKTQERLNKVEFQETMEETGIYGGTEQKVKVGSDKTVKVDNKLDTLNVEYVKAYENAANAARKYAIAQGEVQALEDKGIDSGKAYREAVEKEAKAQKGAATYEDELAKATKNLTKEQKKLDKYGTPEGMEKSAKTLKQNIKAADENAATIKKMSKAYAGLSNKIANNELFGKGKTQKTISQLKTLGKQIGITASKGDKIAKIDVTKFVNGIKEMGGSTEDAQSALQKLADENPDIQLKVDTKSFKDDVQGAIQAATGETAEAKGKLSIDVQTDSQKIQAVKTALSKIPETTKANINVQRTGASPATTLTNLNKLNGKKVYSDIYVTKHVKKTDEAHGTRHFASGGISDLTSNAQVNEQGFEIIQDGKTGAMRVANAGKRGPTYLNRGDAVYTHGQSMRMLAQAGLTEADLLQGKIGDVGVYGVKKLEGFKKGTSKKAKQKAFDKALEKLEFNRDYYGWTDKQFQAKYKALYKQYKKYLTTDQKRSFRTDYAEYTREYGSTGLEYYKASADYQIEQNQKLFENQEITYDKMKEVLKDYFDEGKITAEEYYNYLEEAQEQNLENTQTQYERQSDFISQWLDYQIEQEEKANDLLEAQADLLSATSQKVKVYKEGVGFVYEQDEEAVKEAQENLKDYNSVWQQLKDAMDEAQTRADLSEAGLLAGSEIMQAVFNAGTDASAWSKIISQVVGGATTYDTLGELGLTDIDKVTSQTNVAGNQVWNIDTISLPDVTNANEFVSQLQTMAIQATGSRS